MVKAALKGRRLTGGGIVGTYYAKSDFSGTSFQRTDVRIDFPKTTVAPGGSLAADPTFGAVAAGAFSVQWTGALIPKYTEPYILKIAGDDSLTLKINDHVVATATAAAGWVTATYDFVAGQKYAVSIALVQAGGPWQAQVHWLSTGPQPFAEKAIEPVTPIGINFADDVNGPANGALIGECHASIDRGTGPAVDGNGWPMGDFAISRMGDCKWGTGPYSFPNPTANDTITGVWTISFTGSAEAHTNGQGQFLINYDDGKNRTKRTLNGKTYYSYAGDLPLSALHYAAATGAGYNPGSNTTTVLFLLEPGGFHNVGFKNTDRNGKGTPAQGGTPAHDGLTHVAAMKPTSVGSTTSYAPGTVYMAPYLATAAPYTVLRDLGSSYDLDYKAAFTSHEVFNNITLASALKPGAEDSVPKDVDICVQFGLHHVGYEGGFDFGDGGNHATAAQQQASNDMRIIPYMQQTVDQYFRAGGSLPIAMEWAIIDGVWDTPPYAPAPPKLQAYLNVQNAVPATPTYGLAVPADFPLPYGQKNGGRCNQTFRVTSHGTYSAGFVVSGPHTGATGTVQVLIDGVVVGTTTTTHKDPYGGDSYYVDVTLPPGLHGMALVFSNVNPSNNQIALASQQAVVPYHYFVPNEGAYAKPVNVTITATGKETIRYTTDGAPPTGPNAHVYTGPIPVSATTSIAAIVSQEGLVDSDMNISTYRTGDAAVAQAQVTSYHVGNSLVAHRIGDVGRGLITHV